MSDCYVLYQIVMYVRLLIIDISSLFFCVFFCSRSQLATAQELVQMLNEIAKETNGVSTKTKYSVRKLTQLNVHEQKILLPLQRVLTPHLPALRCGTQSGENTVGRSSSRTSTRRGSSAKATEQRKPMALTLEQVRNVSFLEELCWLMEPWSTQPLSIAVTAVLCMLGVSSTIARVHSQLQRVR